MPISISKLEEASGRYSFEKPADSIEEARGAGLQVAYLSHSPGDLVLAEGLQVLMKDRGWNVYLDCGEEGFSEKASRETVERVRDRIRESDWFLFLATAESTNSRWKLWELGYAHGVKLFDSILVIPTKDQEGLWHGTELLQFYRHIDVTSSQRFGAFRPTDDRGVLVGDLSVPEQPVEPASEDAEVGGITR